MDCAREIRGIASIANAVIPGAARAAIGLVGVERGEEADQRGALP